MDTGNLLEVKNLRLSFHTPNGVLRAVEDVSFGVKRGETLGIVGESGCGKSVSCLSILRLVQSPPAVYEGGEIIFDGQHDILKMESKRLQELRGNRIAMIFQEPMAALNPVYTIGQQMIEAIRLHLPHSKEEAEAMALGLLEQVRIPNAKKVLQSYPFTLSGGMRQRVMIAMAMSCSPDLLIADEPTTALDVTIQAQILALMRQLKEETGAAIIFITHDLGVISETADRVMVMYAGRVCETAATRDLLRNPLHPYTRGLIASKPSRGDGGKRLRVIPGNVPSLLDKPAGCPFNPRCDHADARCESQFPPMSQAGEGHQVACWQMVKEEGGDPA